MSSARRPEPRSGPETAGSTSGNLLALALPAERAASLLW
ncbi:MAG: hypothetical protein V7637_5164, partial [Mycobacteriales bacterium]